MKTSERDDIPRIETETETAEQVTVNQKSVVIEAKLSITVYGGDDTLEHWDLDRTKMTGRESVTRALREEATGQLAAGFRRAIDLRGDWDA